MSGLDLQIRLQSSALRSTCWEGVVCARRLPLAICELAALRVSKQRNLREELVHACAIPWYNGSWIASWMSLAGSARPSSNSPAARSTMGTVLPTFGTVSMYSSTEYNLSGG